MKELTEKEMLEWCRKYVSILVTQLGTQNNVAKQLGISGAYLSDVLNGNRGLPSLADKLGWERVVTFKSKRIKDQSKP